MQQGRAYSAENSAPHFLESWCRLIRDQRWSTRQKRLFIDYFGDPHSVLNAPLAQLEGIASGKQRSTRSMIDEQNIEDDLAWLEAKSNHLIAICDDTYPLLLRQLHDPPLALFAIGDIKLLNEPQVAIVGSRKPTPIGDQAARNISRGLADLGVIVTSGMALGIDGAAHQAALDQGAPSVAVLGNGLDTVYPSRHRALFQRLATNGVLISEYPLGVKPNRYTFPQRNRLVSGMSHGVVIVEAADRSGTLITARLALEQNRELMVVPGSALSKQYNGSHHLIKQGAALVSSAIDVVHCLSDPLGRCLSNSVSECTGSSEVKNNQVMNVDASHALLGYISTESTAIDDIILGSQLTSAEVSSMLLELELIGAVAIADDGGYVNLS